ncbi:hypothetical protein Tco_0517641 [Tanacetum coccineum]
MRNVTMAPLWSVRTSRILAFSVADNAEEITIRSWLFSYRMAYSRAFHSSGSTGSGLGYKETAHTSFESPSSSASTYFLYGTHALSKFSLDTELVLYPLQDKLTSGDKSLDLSPFKLSRLFFSLLSSGSFSYWRSYGA